MIRLTGAPTQANSTANVTFAYGFDSYADGAAYYDTPADQWAFTGPTQILVRVIDPATGLPAGVEVTLQLPQPPAGFVRFTASPLMLADGSYLLADVYVSSSNSPSSEAIYHYSSNGAFLGLLQSATSGNVVARADGNFDLFAQSSTTANGFTTSSLVKSTFTPQGVLVDGPTTLYAISYSSSQNGSIDGYGFGSGNSTAMEIGQEITELTKIVSDRLLVWLPGATMPIIYASPASTLMAPQYTRTGGAGFAPDGAFIYGVISYNGTASPRTTLNVYCVEAGGSSPALLMSLNPYSINASLTVLGNGDIAVNQIILGAATNLYMFSSRLYSPTGNFLGAVVNGAFSTNDNGELFETFLSGGSAFVQSAQTAPGTKAQDFFGAGTSDMLFRNAAGVTYLWTMNGANVVSGATTSVQVGANWAIGGIADFNGDGSVDLLWSYNNVANAADPLNGVSYISLQSGPSAIGGGVVQQLTVDWQVAGTGDFNGDGKADLLYRNTNTGQTYLDIMNGSSVEWAASGFASAQVTDPNWQIAGVADFNGDGNTDVLWRYDNISSVADPLNGALYEWQMNGTTVTSAGLLSQQAGKNWQVAGTGDFNGDGNADILFRYENAANAADTLNGFTYIDMMNGATVTSGAPTQWQVDNSWAIASIGDYNGDGMSDILLQQTATGNAYIWQMNGANVTSGAFTSSQAGTGWTVQNGVLIG